MPLVCIQDGYNFGSMGWGRCSSGVVALVGGLAVLLLVSGCEDGAKTGRRALPKSTGSAVPSAESTTAVPGLTSTSAVTASLAPDTRPGVFVGASGFAGEQVDHVSLAFLGGPPPCVARYVEPPVTGPDGEQVVVSGSAFVRIRCRQVTGARLEPHDDEEDIGQLRPGADRFLVPSANSVAEVVRVGYDDSVLTLVVGLRHVAPMTWGVITSGKKRFVEFVFGRYAVVSTP